MSSLFPSSPACAAGLTPKLALLEVLVLDCQTTGNTPNRGQVLELAWSGGRAADEAWEADPRIVTQLVALPGGERLPPRIAKLTGIDHRELARAPGWREVHGRLTAEVRRLAESSADGVAHGVAHYARFERTFLEDWRRRAELSAPGSRSSALELHCTHEIVIRLLPGLPRRGLRAAAGYLGHVMAEERRARGHVRATVAVWCALVRELAHVGVHTLADLDDWLHAKKPERRGGREFSLPRDVRLGLPDAPGVYRMRARGGQVLYVGKATSLKARVNSYFQNRHRRAGGDKTLELLTQVADVDVTPCGSALEAAMREADAIKEHAPPYNSALRGREPAAFFLAPETGSLRAKADARHWVGPLPRRDALEALAAQRRLLEDPSVPPLESRVWDAALGLGAAVPGEDGRIDRARLDSRGLSGGLALFRAHAGWEGRRSVSPRELLRVGARLWREHLAEEALARQRGSAAKEQAAKPAADAPREPEDVARWFSLALGRCAQLLRRAKWYERLSEASLWWRTRAGKEHVLRVERGGLARCTESTRATSGAAAPGERAPIPRWFASPAAERRRSFDAAAYDRMRVLTTELRRLLARGAEVEVRLGHAPALRGDALARRLRGV